VTQPWDPPPQEYVYYAPYAGHRLATWFERMGAALIDVVVITLGLSVFVGVTHPADPDGLSQELGRLSVWLAPVILGFFNGGYGQTVGKKLLRIKLLREADGQVIGVGVGLVRGFAHLADTLSIGVGYLWPLWDEKHQTFADKMTKTVVIKL